MKGMHHVTAGSETYEVFNTKWLDTIRLKTMRHFHEMDRTKQTPPGELVAAISNDSRIYLTLGTIFGDVVMSGRHGKLSIEIPIQLQGILTRRAFYPEDIEMIFGSKDKPDLHQTLVTLVKEGTDRLQIPVHQ